MGNVMGNREVERPGRRAATRLAAGKATIACVSRSRAATGTARVRVRGGRASAVNGGSPRKACDAHVESTLDSAGNPSQRS